MNHRLLSKNKRKEERGMKHLKKLAGCLLALVMILTMSNVAVVNAANNTENGYDTSGSITIEDAVSGQVYRIYRVLDLESYDSEKGAYAYKANPQWATWLSGQNNYISTDNQGYVTWKDGADAVTFAKNALNYAKSNSGISSRFRPKSSPHVKWFPFTEDDYRGKVRICQVFFLANSRKI